MINFSDWGILISIETNPAILNIFIPIRFDSIRIIEQRVHGKMTFEGQT